MSGLFQHYFPNIPIIPNQGNHDTYPIDQTLPIIDKRIRQQIGNIWKYGIEAVTNDNYMDLYYRLESENKTRLSYCEHFLGGNCSEGKAIELVKDIYLG